MAPSSLGQHPSTDAPERGAVDGTDLDRPAVKGDRAKLTAEAADVIYHLLVMLAARDVTLADVEAELARREGTSGIAEKAAR